RDQPLFATGDRRALQRRNGSHRAAQARPAVRSRPEASANHTKSKSQIGNVECRKSNVERMTNLEARTVACARDSVFDIRHSFDIRIWSFVIRPPLGTLETSPRVHLPPPNTPSPANRRARSAPR